MTMTEPVKVQIHQQAGRVKPSYNTSTQESTTNKIDGTIAQGLAKENRNMRKSNMRDLISDVDISRECFCKSSCGCRCF